MVLQVCHLLLFPLAQGWSCGRTDPEVSAVTYLIMDADVIR
jgi:hypothetical protein